MGDLILEAATRDIPFTVVGFFVNLVGSSFLISGIAYGRLEVVLWSLPVLAAGFAIIVAPAFYRIWRYGLSADRSKAGIAAIKAKEQG